MSAQPPPMKTMQRAVQVTDYGGPEVLQYVMDAPVPPLRPGAVLVKNHFSGVNFIDVYQRSGSYPLDLPLILGQEASGTIVVSHDGKFKVGQRVSYLAPATYAEYTVASNDRMLALPSNVSDEMGAATLLQGLAALCFVKRAYKVNNEDTILIHAAAGGTGGLLVQLCKYYSAARVIGTTSTPEKAAEAIQIGCDNVILYTEKDAVKHVKRLTGGMGVDVVYDGVGQSTFQMSVDCLRRGGTLVSFGEASGAVEADDLSKLSRMNITLVRPALFEYLTSREDFDELANELLRVYDEGAIKFRIHKIYNLADAASAHKDLEGRSVVDYIVINT